MDKFIIDGATPLAGEVAVGGAKNVALKMLVASLLTDDELIIENVPRIQDVFFMLEVLRHLGVSATFDGHVLTARNGTLKDTTVPLDVGARLRTSSMVLGPLLCRAGHAKIPNPGGCRLGARPIDRHIEALRAMGADISYRSADGFFHASTSALHGATIVFPKNTHTGTESIILAAVLASGTTVIQNAAAEVEVDDLIGLLNAMGASITRTKEREITIQGVSSLHGCRWRVMPDRNEEVTFAIAALASGGDITVRNSQRKHLAAFLHAVRQAGGGIEEVSAAKTRYFSTGTLRATDIVTGPHPGFMTDWQAPWALVMTQAVGSSTIHETVFESRFSYVPELQKMGATIAYFDPDVADPASFYNFNWQDRQDDTHQGITITGPRALHNAVVNISDLRAGATLVLAALCARGQSIVHGVEQVDRGYEQIELRLANLGAKIVRTKEEHI